MSKPEHDELRRQITDLLAKGLIEPSSSPFAAPVLFVQKKSGELRMCIDYRQLNKITIRDQYPLPRIDDLFDQLAGKTVFSSLDLQAGYHQIRIPAEDVPKTAFRTPEGHYQFKVLCFGLTNAPATFQRVMNEAFAEVINDCALVYLDDILVMSKDSEEHLVHLRRVFDLLRKNKFYAKLSKCEFMKRTLMFLGHIISAQGISVDPCKVTAISNWPVPTSLKTLQSFLGAANYVRKFVHNFSTIAAPLTNLTGPKKDSFPWKSWPQAELDAFNALKQAIANVPMLKLTDHSKPFQVHCDASLEGIGAVLMQDGYPLAYYSRKLIPAEVNYTTGEQELLALVSACQQWRPPTKRVTWAADVPADGEPSAPKPPGPLSNLHEWLVRAYAADSNFTKRRKTKNYYLDDNGLWRHNKRRTVIVPRDKQLREHILHEMHDAKYAGHVGITKTLERVMDTFSPNEMRTARRPLEATGTLAYISHAVSLQTGKRISAAYLIVLLLLCCSDLSSSKNTADPYGGSAATQATVGSITVHTGNIRGQAYDYMPYAGATSAAATSSRRRMDPSLGPLGLNLASGLHGEDTTHMQYLGNVTRAELQPRAPRYIEVPQLKRGNQAAVSATIAKHLEKQGTPAIDGVSCTVNKITIDNIDMYMATYGVRVAAKDVPAILTAHETDPVIVDIHSGLKVEEGRMRCITSEAGAAMGSHTTRAYVQIHAMPSLFSCDSNSKVITPSSPSRLAEIRQVIHSAGAGTLLAEFGSPPDDPQMLPAYVARVKSSELYTLLRALDVTALTPDPSHRQGLYVIHSDNDQLTAMLSKYHKIQVTVQHMLKLTIYAAEPLPVPRYAISISSATGNMESMAALPKILWHLQNQHVNGKLPELLDYNADAETNKNWKARITTETPRPLHFSSAQGDLLCLKTEGDKHLLEITYKHPLTNQVTTFTTEGSNAAAAAMVFCAMDGSSLETDNDLRRHSVVLLRAGSKQDQINVLSALLCKAEWEGLHAGLPRHMIGPVPQKERPRPPVLFSSIVGEEEHDSVGINRDLTGLNYISGLDFFVLRSVCATAEDCQLQYVRNANALSSLYTTGMQYMLLAWLARDNTNCTMAPEVVRAGSHLPPTQPPRAAPRTGLGLSLRLVAAQAQLQDPSAAIPTRPPSTSAGTSQTLRPPAGSRPYTAGRGQPAIGGRGQPQLGAGNSRGPSPTGGRGKGDPAGSQGNRSSRGSSGNISDFDELAITAGITPSLKAPAPSKAPANDPKHPQVHETSGQNPP
ncbi:hypothetical protein QJQ45_030269, partial [Haematococcus lacustris]